MTGVSAGEVLLWIIFPYVAVATFVVGTWWRYRADQFGWTSGSTQIFEQKILGWAGPAFHYGALLAVGGHVIGLMIPKSFTEAIGMSENTTCSRPPSRSFSASTVPLYGTCTMFTPARLLKSSPAG